MEGTAPDGRPMVHLLGRDTWRAWLGDNHASAARTWVVSYRKATGSTPTRLPRDPGGSSLLRLDRLQAGQLDEERSILWLSPRKPKSAWSGLNKERVQRLIDEGLMTEAGLRMVESAKASGTWDMLVARIDETARLAAAGEKANKWRPATQNPGSDPFP